LLNSVIIGNGKSRKDKDLKSIQNANIIACNWFFKHEFEPDVLITSDEDITNYIAKNYPNLKCHYKSNSNDASGATGTRYAVDNFKSDNIFLVGMDFFGIEGKVNNVYSGELYYTPEGFIAPDSNDWQIQFEIIVREHPEVTFYHVDPHGESPRRLARLNNFHKITYEGMVTKLKRRSHND